ncbi:hypothetical protein BJ508DRAFT_418618 [Ascobolus immersus RN42]|uniref:Uncharacterized protein n=1 Tax=Ascobolus immersus RN42 TaxID=1160509 RepID=A0A3N4HPQ0_ASCIM|nr:hypothetical protein BJ508DRAFT_418618 [Ascobolus immersus RN42]
MVDRSQHTDAFLFNRLHSSLDDLAHQLHRPLPAVAKSQPSNELEFEVKECITCLNFDLIELSSGSGTTDFPIIDLLAKGQDFKDFIQRLGRGLVREKLVKLIIMWLEVWKCELRIAMEIAGGYESVQDVGDPGDKEGFTALRRLIAEEGEKKHLMLLFWVRLRSESVEERIWGHLHADEENLGLELE